MKGGEKMFDKILYPTDFSRNAEKCLAFVQRLREAGTREVVLLHVLDRRSFDLLSALDSETTAHAAEENMVKSSLEKLNETAQELKNSGLAVKIRVEKGVPFSEILKIAEEEDVSAIIVGSHGTSNLTEVLLGSVSEKVIRKSKRTVLVVKR
ncbi:MAG: universal stress protein [Deltaproteobacteria bacterium]|nr:universal stress protein [Deltaproteobacteria bacterium]